MTPIELLNNIAVKILNFTKFKMADGRYLENRKMAISPQWFYTGFDRLA